MKYAVLAAALTLAVPTMAIAAMWLPRVRGHLFSLMIFLTCLGAHASVNAVSRELYRGPDRGFEVTGADLVCWALMIAITLRFPGKIAWFPRNSWLLLLFFLNACLLALVTMEPLYTAFSLWKCVRIYCLYWTTVNCLRLGIHRRYAWLGFAGAALVITALALQQKYLLGIYRINGPFDHSNTVPLYANLILPVLLIWALCDKELPLRWAVVSIALCFGLLFAVLSTFSRLGMALSSASVVCALGWANLRSRSIRVRASSLVMSLLLLAGAIRAAGPIIERIRSAPEASVQARDEFNYAAQLMLGDHPFGVGLNNFSYVVTNQVQYRAHFEAMKSEEQSGVCHHIYWLTAAETGYLGLLLYLVLVVRFAGSALAGSWRRKSTEGAILFGVFLGICALQVSGFYEWAFRVTPVMQMFTISAAVAVVWSEKPLKHRVRMAAVRACGEGVPSGPGVTV
ncbi:putative O-Antigen ligase [Candidatus Sulfopaludibacter sp. SbA6]|nr:putative O-Antigen ligase [Candidatus Sulfopaludibacter sp. SbA6]